MQGKAPAPHLFLNVELILCQMQKKKVHENFRGTVVLFDVGSTAQTAQAPVVAHQLDEAKRASNINAHDVFPHTPNVIRGELLNVFSNNGGGAPDIDPGGGDGETS